jgi:hypothetical protein
MPQLDTATLANIGQGGADIGGSMAKAYQLKDLIDTTQLRQMDIKRQQQEAAEAGQIKTLAGQFDLSSPDGQNQFVAQVSKINPRQGMQFQREFQDTQHGQNALVEDQYKLLDHQHQLVENMVAPLAQAAMQMKAAGRSPQEIDAALLPQVMQTIEAGKKATLPNGKPAMGDEDLKMASQMVQAGNLGDTLPALLQRTKSGREQIQQYFQQQNIQSEIANREKGRALEERKVRVLESGETRKTAAAAATKAGGLSDDSKDLIAGQILAGKKPSDVMGSIGRGAQGAKDVRDIQNRVAAMAKDQGVSPQALVAAQQELTSMNRAISEAGRREGAIASSVREAKKFGEAALAANSSVDRGSFMPWNKLTQMGEKGLSDPKLAAFYARTTSFLNAYVKATSGGGASDAASREHARAMLSTAQSPEAYKAVVEALLNETDLAAQAPTEVIAEMAGRTAGRPVAPSPPAGAPAAPPSSQSPAGAGAASRTREWTPGGIK